MPSDKAKVTSYLGDEEKAVFDKLCKENGFSNSEGVAHLIREQLIERKGAQEAIAHWGEYEERIEALEDSIKGTAQFKASYHHKMRQAESRVDVLEREAGYLKQQVADAAPNYFLDEEIASVTGCREQQVYEWRMGLRKPRGGRILRKLEPYEIKDGRWVKKKVRLD